jgi:hypothetical protein
MVTRYRTSKHATEIQPREVIKETKNTVTFQLGMGDGTFRNYRENRIADWQRWHNTWEDAHAFLLKRAEDAVVSLRRQLERANNELDNIKGLKKPDPK